MAMATVSVPALILKLMVFPSVAPVTLPIIVRVPVAPEYVKFTLGVPKIVSPVAVEVVHAVVLFPVTEILPVPKSIDRVLLLLDAKFRHDKTFAPSEKVPCVSVNAPLMDSAAPKVSCKALELRVAIEHVAPEAVVHVPVPELASKTTVSAARGGPAPAAPPDDADQLAVLAPSQVPVPPTQ